MCVGVCILSATLCLESLWQEFTFATKSPRLKGSQRLIYVCECLCILRATLRLRVFVARSMLATKSQRHEGSQSLIFKYSNLVIFNRPNFELETSNS